MALIDDIEHLATRLNSLREAELLAIEAQPQMVPEIRRLMRDSLRTLYTLVSKIMAIRVQIGGAPPRLPMEVLERLFAVLRDQAEMEWSRSLKLSGGVSKRARAEADRLARLAHDAAVALKITAEARGVWNETYDREHGVGPWL